MCIQTETDIRSVDRKIVTHIREKWSTDFGGFFLVCGCFYFHRVVNRADL